VDPKQRRHARVGFFLAFFFGIFRQDADETYELDAVADLAIWIKSSIQFLDGWISRNTRGTP